MEYWIIVAAFFCIALIYSSVGFGGGSSYTALLAIFAFSPNEIKSASLVCNIVVVTGSVYVFWKAGGLTWRSILPYLMLSMPLAFLGARFPISSRAFFLVLATALLVSSIALMAQGFLSRTLVAPNNSPEAVKKSLLGGAVGFLSGMVGIGGGIFLAPVLHFLGWHTAKVISGLAAIFILMNSVMGLAGQLSLGLEAVSLSFLAPLALAVLVGGQLGARAGAKKFNPATIKWVTAVLIFAAALILFSKHL